jgi:hypothetical protein
MAARLPVPPIVFAGLVMFALLAGPAATARAQSGPNVPSGNGLKRSDAGTRIPLRDWYLAGRIGGFVSWATPRLLPGAGRPTRTFESTPVRPRAFAAPRLAGRRLP